MAAFDEPLTSDEFYKWVGICIKEWATIEARLYDICALALKVNPKQVAIVYGRTPTSMRDLRSLANWF
jgi:hypothetical protein